MPERRAATCLSALTLRHSDPDLHVGWQKPASSHTHFERSERRDSCQASSTPPPTIMAAPNPAQRSGRSPNNQKSITAANSRDV